MQQQVLVLGLDGADWRILQGYIEDGTMPNLARLVEEGISGPLRSTIPPQSPVAWTSFLTGQSPAKHSVFDFRERSPLNPARLVGVNSRSIRTETFLHTLSRYGRRVGAVNIPFTFPPFAVNGFWLSGWAGRLEGASYTHPEGFAVELDEQVNGFPLDGMEWGKVRGQPSAFVDKVIDVTCQHARTLQYVMRRKEWDVLVQVFEGPDRLQHGFMHILDPGHPRHDPSLAQELGPKLRAFFSTVDEVVGAAQRDLPSDAVLMLVSDHGFRSVYKLFNLKDILKDLGYLKTRQDLTVEKSARNMLRKFLKPMLRSLPRHINPKDIGAYALMGDLDWPATSAYTTTYSSLGVWINLAGREPDGIVSPGEEFEGLLNQIRTKLLAVSDPANGLPIVSQVIPTNELYDGPMLHYGPDLLVLPAEGLAPSSVDGGPNLTPMRKSMGFHDLSGIFLASGPGIRRGERISGASIMDLAPTILYMADIPISIDLDGQVLDLFRDNRLTERPPTYVQAETVPRGHDFAYTLEEQMEVEDQLRSLGYL